MSRAETTKKIDTAKKDKLSQLMGTTRRTIDNHISEEKQYIDFLNQFTIAEIEEFIETGGIERLQLAYAIPIESLREIANASRHQFDEHMLKGALFKVQFGMDGNLILPIFKQSIETIPMTHGEEIRKQLIQRVSVYKSGVFTHKNHKIMVIEFIENYLTNRELELLLAYYRKTEMNSK